MRAAPPSLHCFEYSPAAAAFRDFQLEEITLIMNTPPGSPY